MMYMEGNANAEKMLSAADATNVHQASINSPIASNAIVKIISSATSSQDNVYARVLWRVGIATIVRRDYI